MAQPGGVLSVGFVWQLAEYDDVFKAYLRKVGFPELTEDERQFIIPKHRGAV